MRWFTSDLHLGHTSILKYQPNRYDYLQLETDDLNEMNLKIVNKLNDYIQPEDTVWILGDVCMGKRDESLNYVSMINGIKHLITGNHCACHPSHSHKPEKQGQWIRKYLEAGFETIQTSAFADVNGIAFAMSHFPYYGDHTEEVRYDEYRPTDLGLPLVHGHVHDLYKTLDKMFNVGIDAHNGVPVSEVQILKWLLSLN